jgi:hypothetical protein
MQPNPIPGLGSRLRLAVTGLAALALMTAGCTTGGAPSGSQAATTGAPSPQAASSFAGVISGQSSETLSTAVGDAPSAAVLPAALSGRSATEIQQQIAGSKLLDGVHAAANVGCEECHRVSAPTDSPAIPTMTDCLPCHGGSYESVAARTARLGDRNPHYSHQGEVECTWCHKQHQPFEHYCNSCHSFGVPTKYRVST